MLLFWLSLWILKSEPVLAETHYEDRTDNIETKLRLLQKAYRNGEKDLALSLAASLKETLRFEQQSDSKEDGVVLDAEVFAATSQWDPAWKQWAHGWSFFKVLQLTEQSGLARLQEPVDVRLSFRQDQVVDLQREIRVARLDAATGVLHEVVSQVYEEGYSAEKSICRLVFLADVEANGHAWYVVLYGNPFAELPNYATDLEVKGEGYDLEIANRYFQAWLSPQTGQLERMTYRGQPEIDLFIGGDGHGEPPHIDWAHDYLAANGFQKFRMTNWQACPNYTVTRGPLCIKVRRWGFPHGPVHPLFTPSRLHMDITYVFYAGLPYFLKNGRMEAVQDFQISYLRDDEWLFAGQPFTDLLWMDHDGALHEGPVAAGFQDDLWGVGFFNRHNRAAFIALWLEHSAENFDGLVHSGAPVLDYAGDIHLWSRWAAHGEPHFAAGAVLKQKNAYLVSPYETPGQVEEIRKKLLHPLQIQAGVLPVRITPTRRHRSNHCYGMPCARCKTISFTRSRPMWWIWAISTTFRCNRAKSASL